MSTGTWNEGGEAGDEVNRVEHNMQGHFMLSGSEGIGGILPSPAGRGDGGERPMSRHLPVSGLMLVLPSPQTPLPVGEGFYIPSA